jgi:hypothetical protein
MAVGHVHCVSSHEFRRRYGIRLQRVLGLPTVDYLSPTSLDGHEPPIHAFGETDRKSFPHARHDL